MDGAGPGGARGEAGPGLRGGAVCWPGRQRLETSWGRGQGPAGAISDMGNILFGEILIEHYFIFIFH